MQSIPDKLDKGEFDGCGYSDASHTHNIYYNVVVDTDAQAQRDFVDFRRTSTLAADSPYDPMLGDTSVAADDQPNAGDSRTRIYFARGVYGGYVVATTPTGGKAPAVSIANLILGEIG